MSICRDQVVDALVFRSLQQNLKATTKSLRHAKFVEVNRSLGCIIPKSMAPASMGYFLFCLPLPLPFFKPCLYHPFLGVAARLFECAEDFDERRLPPLEAEFDLPLDDCDLLPGLACFFGNRFGVGALTFGEDAECFEEPSPTIFTLCFSMSSSLLCTKTARAPSSFKVIGLCLPPLSLANLNKAGNSTSFTPMLFNLDLACNRLLLLVHACLNSRPLKPNQAVHKQTCFGQHCLLNPCIIIGVLSKPCAQLVLGQVSAATLHGQSRIHRCF